MGKKDRVFLVSSKTSIGVLESQLFSLANLIAFNYNFNVRVFLVGEIIDIDISKYKNIEISYLDKKTISSIKNSVIYIRTIDIFLKNYLNLKFKGNHIVYDFRALLFVESYNRNKNRFKRAIIFLLELLVYLLADQVCAVSKSLKLKLGSLFLIKRKVFVFPCLVFNNLNGKNIKANFDSNIIKFVYTGGLSGWQKFEEILSIYKKFSKECKMDTSLTIITRSKDEAVKILETMEVSADVKSLTNDEVLKELLNYQFGFLIRENNLLNNIASPIKFLEYLSCGVIPILSYGVGDYSEEAEKREISILLNEKDELSLNKIKGFIKDRNVYERLDKFNQEYSVDNSIKNHHLL
jgi:hypothetical protein